ncbi:cilia- and flagella-associated protein 44-like [Diaphorina citri]|uniref:Cilia- and flagella-associated protein 44-like n=1 Tax=Diaphorina citri TaxID=121845 RepID=A0A1S3DDE8_DIACI|nr:cilia- and flagella-associated protein 44-like [Diaphorina citri]
MWKMVNTFTSLKLLGVIGRFGKTTTCDILAIYPMPDEKVLSGCEWGNILVWDDGMIKIEVSRKNRRPCHADQIVQFLYDPQTLQITTVGADGFIRMWNYQTIDLANPPEEEK